MNTLMTPFISGKAAGLLMAVCAILPGTLLSAANRDAASPRVSVSLDGLWQIGESGMESPPASFERKVPVPGLVDMAEPAIVEPGPGLTHLDKFSQKDPRRDAFWYRRTFTLDRSLPAAATLKVGKAMFGTRAILNGMLLGDHAACFTPGLFDARAALKTGENELL
ncbi:MAG: hypothetical protein K9N23_21050, partial [Akkermansiaceae bacterium]|nr:hypothetical protein [Akkermansiaceae bacterium]